MARRRQVGKWPTSKIELADGEDVLFETFVIRKSYFGLSNTCLLYVTKDRLILLPTGVPLLRKPSILAREDVLSASQAQTEWNGAVQFWVAIDTSRGTKSFNLGAGWKREEKANELVEVIQRWSKSSA